MSLNHAQIGHVSQSRLFTLVLIASTFVFAALDDARAQNITFKKIALRGETVPGAGPPATLNSFYSPVINNAGEVAFRAFLNGPDVGGDNRGIFRESGGVLSQAVREGNEAPSVGPGFSILDLNSFYSRFNDAGQTAFTASLRGPGVNAFNMSTLFTETGGTLTLVARADTAAPGVGPGVRFRHLDRSAPSLNSAGELLFYATLTGTGVNSTNYQSFYINSNKGLNLIARTGDSAPGAGPGFHYSDFSYGALLNDAGQVAFSADLTGPGGVQRTGIYSGFANDLRPVAISGGAATPAGPGVAYASLTSFRLNNAGQTSYLAWLEGPGLDLSNNYALFSEGSGDLRLVARRGVAAPNTGPGVSFLSFRSFRLNDAGQTAFTSTLTGPGVDDTNDLGLYLNSGDALSLIARTGDAVPSVGSGVRFSDINFDNTLFNNAGQIAFLGALTGQGVDSTNDVGLFAADSEGNIRLLLRSGDTLDVNPAPLITDNHVVGGFNLGSINNVGQLVFEINFTDYNRGVFVANTAVPEPASLALLGLGCLALVGLRRRLLPALS